MDIEEKSVIAFIGPSGCGKSTFLRLLNRMNDLIPDTRLTGEIRIDGQDIYGKGVQVDELRKNVGMVFQRPNPFPKSIFENVAYGLRVNGITDNSFIRQRVEETLKGAALWDEVKDKLKVSAYALSGGQQINAPFTREVHDEKFLKDFSKKLADHGAKLVVIWVVTKPEICHQRMIDRNSVRDTWKLEHWDEYVKTIDYSIPEALKKMSNCLDLMLFYNSSDEEYQKSMEMVISRLEDE